VPDSASLLKAALAGYAAEHGALGDGAVELLADLGDILDNSTIRQAARVLSGNAGGRPPVDDAELLAGIRKVVAAGAARSLWHACGMIAKGHAKTTGARADTVQRRLFTKAQSAKIVLRKPDTSEAAKP
jgi:hypothetical protein